jgi:hypothetical protein
VEARVCALDGTGSQLVAGGADHHLDRLPPCGRLPIAGIPKPQKQLRKAGWAADRRCQAGTELGDLDWLVQVGRRDALGAGAKEEIAERLAGGEPLARRVTVCRLSAASTSRASRVRSSHTKLCVLQPDWSGPPSSCCLPLRSRGSASSCLARSRDRRPNRGGFVPAFPEHARRQTPRLGECAGISLNAHRELGSTATSSQSPKLPVCSLTGTYPIWYI